MPDEITRDRLGSGVRASREEPRPDGCQYEMIVSTVNDPMSFVDRNYIYRAVNEAYANIFRRPRTAILGHSVADLMGPEVFEQKIRLHIDRCLQGEEVYYEEWFEYPSRGLRYVIMKYYPFYDDDGTISGIAVSASDITEHKQTEETLRNTTRELLIRNEIDRIFLTAADDDVTREIIALVLEALEIGYGIFGHLNYKGEMVDHSMSWSEEQGCRPFAGEVVFNREAWDVIWRRARRQKTTFGVQAPIDVPAGQAPISEALVVPIVFQGDAIGTLMVASADGGLGGREEQQLLEAIVNHIAPILKARLQRNCEEDERKKAQEELRQANDVLEETVARRTAELLAANAQLRREIDERNRIQQALVQSREMLRAQYRGFPVPTFTFQHQDGGFVLIDFNAAAEISTWGEIVAYRGKYFDELTLGQSSILEDVRACYLNHSIVTRETCSSLFVTDVAKMINLTCSYVPPDMVMVHMEDITERKKAELALKRSEESLRTLSAKLFNAKEEERKHISRELHDGIGQYLTSIKFVTENTINRVAQGPCAAEMEPLGTIVPIIQTVIDEVRKMSMNLRPSTLDDFGICVTIDWFCKEFQQIYKEIRVAMHLDITEEEVPDELKIIIFRILQEALNNVATHSRADSVRVGLAGSAAGIELVIEDDGSGFDLHSKKTTQRADRGLGLVSMKERTELCGGTFRIDSAEGAGTCIRAHWLRRQVRSG